jgi:ATP-dependent DNA helicase PIF1
MLGKTLRCSNRPFGGIQVIFSGDFYQLPPVGNMNDMHTVQFCFESPLWEEVFKIENIIVLKKIFRQTDEKYIDILNQIREGKLKKINNDFLLNFINNKPLNENDGIMPTQIFSTKHRVNEINGREMTKLTGEEIVFEAAKINNNNGIVHVGKPQHTQKEIDVELETIKNSLLCDNRVILKVGAQVMCIINFDLELGICNGSCGVITRFENGFPVVKFKNVEIVMKRHVWESEIIEGIGISQIPLILSWALTIHKCQGITLEKAIIDVGSNIFECGQTYVALSRVKSLDGLFLKDFDPSKIKVNKKVKEFYEELNKKKSVSTTSAVTGAMPSIFKSVAVEC